MREWFFPVGNPVSAFPAEGFLLETELLRAAATSFSGYWVLLGETPSGLCEGLILFESGRLIGCAFESLMDARQSWGEEAMPQVIALFKNKRGVVDVVHLSLPQVGLVPAFYSAIRLGIALEPKDLIKQIPTKYDGKGGPDATKTVSKRELTRFELFARRGLAGLHKD